MRTEDFQPLSQFGKALWWDPQRASQATADAVTAVSTLDLNPDRAIDRAAEAILERASMDGVGINASGLNDPFWRLQPEERFILSALHQARWSYQRVARVLRVNEDRVGEIAWTTRLHLASLAPDDGPQKRTPLPTGPKLGLHCPDYDPNNPWTQRFLDEELSGKQRHFLQNHLMACDACRKSLNDCRRTYYRVEKLVPGYQSRDELSSSASQLGAIWSGTRKFLNHRHMTLLGSLRIFLRRRDIQVVVLFLLVLATLKILL